MHAYTSHTAPQAHLFRAEMRKPRTHALPTYMPPIARLCSRLMVVGGIRRSGGGLAGGRWLGW
ncbi:predicted protein [Plenodomus lingam JN3]|uniref:Predicted protein n=1 Tax=Leptosphaeria maculans (strain JN3 / isolate v23.1.3 / race Av1-4-5-6-7-8) TaxID=985895 RepID=E5A278_LEPMJ|nr:predicted protein [Plenodomus lingam JN3]CBX97955.1 predicted protein [Plenodomus lingam JN3]